MAVKSRRAEHVADTRVALVQAARELFAQRGFAGTGTEEIVAHARVTRGALYHHFKDKADLFQAVMASAAGDLAQRLIQEQTERSPDEQGSMAWDDLRTGFQHYLDACLDSDFQRIVLIDGPAVLGHDAWNDLVEKFGVNLLREYLKEAMTAGQIDTVPVDPLARLLAALIGEASLYIARAPDSAQARVDTGVTLDRILIGLQPAARE
ncbi:MAG TPA: TetR/AcrR family transcriptional regulator [Mycobacteriales bacterium]|nr:TetR/AcrR family transcriptional regulator [Mycobacteriales bacterium]